MHKIIRLIFILQLNLISVAPLCASQSISLAQLQKIRKKAATDELLKVVKREEITSDAIIALISNNADVNAKDQYGRSPLTLAAMYGHVGAGITLIDNGADVHATTLNGITPLMGAAINCHAAVCLALFSRGADVNTKDTSVNSNTPLMLAAGNSWRVGSQEVCILLLRNMLLKQLLTADPEGGDLHTRKMRMRCAIWALKMTNINKELIPLILKSKPLMPDYTICRYDTYCCSFNLNEYDHSITRNQLCELLGQGNIHLLKAALEDAYDACGGGEHCIVKNLLNPANFDQQFDMLFLQTLNQQVAISTE